MNSFYAIWRQTFFDRLCASTYSVHIRLAHLGLGEAVAVRSRRERMGPGEKKFGGVNRLTQEAAEFPLGDNCRPFVYVTFFASVLNQLRQDT